MSNYVQTTFFAPKDSLPPTNPAKTIFGAAYDVEFGNIASAISSKIDATSAVTALAGTANQIAVSGSTGNITISLPLNVILPAPVSGITFVVNGTGSASALQVLGTGVQFGSPTGGDQGAGSVNVSGGFFVNGVAVVAGAAAAGSLTGTTLAANVLSSSLTSLGTLGSLTISGALTGSSIALGGSANEGAGTINATGIFLNGTSILNSISGNSLTGTTLAAGIVNSSLTTVGNLTSLTVASLGVKGSALAFIAPTASPTITSSARLGASPSITRVSAGQYTLTHNLGVAGYACNLSYVSSSGTPANPVLAYANIAANSVTIFTYNGATPTDIGSAVSIEFVF